MFDILVTCYLFLGGAGAGSLIVLSVLELANAPRALTVRIEKEATLRTLPSDFYLHAWPICLVVLLLGVACLGFDLGRFDRVLYLVVSARFSAISIGAYALAIALACAGFFTAVSLLDSFRIPRRVMQVIAGIGILSGIVTAIYTGILLQQMASVLFWNSFLLPLLFFLSSLSTGIACVFLAMAFTETRRPFARAVVRLARIDEVIIILEAVCLAVYLALAHSNPATTETAQAFLLGDLSAAFWLVLIACGLVLPFVLEWYISSDNFRYQLLWICLLVMIGGFTLRYCMVEAATYDVTQSPVAASWFGDGESQGAAFLIEGESAL